MLYIQYGQNAYKEAPAKMTDYRINKHSNFPQTSFDAGTMQRRLAFFIPLVATEINVSQSLLPLF